ncbi:MAG TPA: aminotransferase class I/II-fold pyridoxal phosphate-dependent enzyme [Fimbriimonadaceae bacterium]|nr:aminotransferase class I/II-fold pyridoxal phosphate-dependent enzyme [Fimbriimonadaceae bacterium]
MEILPSLGIETLLTHRGEEKKNLHAVVPPIFQVSTFVFDEYDELMHQMLEDPLGPPSHYSRISNPTLDVVEQKLATLEKTEACKLIQTGMGASCLAIMAHVRQGAHVVTLDTCYGPVKTLLKDYLPKFGVTATFVEGSSVEEWIDAIRPETTMLYLESPSSIIFRLQDIEKITAEAKRRGITTAIDNTYCTPMNSNPATMGVDIVLHSATKYLAGHSDLTAGVICASREFVQRIAREELNLFGSILAPFPAWLLMRGMRTLAVRMRHFEKVGNEVAAFLEGHASVDVVHHVGLPSFPQRDLFLKQMRASSSLLSFEPKTQDKAKVTAFVEALNLFQIGVSWGGHESLVVALQGQPLGYAEPRFCVRLYCGLEDSADLIADIRHAFEVSGL